MREIKFRGRRLDNGKWVTGDLLHGKNGKVLINAGTKMFTTYAEVDPNTVGQFTGLLDKNGKEIYEGDIVRYYDDMEDELVNGHVIYHKESCSFCIAPTKLCGDYIGLNVYWQFEVIGNIYDHPELTKAPKQ